VNCALKGSMIKECCCQEHCQWMLHFNEHFKKVDAVLKPAEMVDIVGLDWEELDKKTMGIFGETDLDIASILGQGVKF
jgi:hypothetical protein